MSLAIAIPANKEVAALKVDAYRRLRRERGRLDITEQTVLRANEAVLKGQKVIEIWGSIAGGGWDAKGRPRLAIARADERAIEVYESSTKVWFTPTRYPKSKGNAMEPRVINIPKAEMPPKGDTVPALSWQVINSAQVPTMPAEIREQHRLKLSTYHILFEAVWNESPVPADPYLLRYLGGSLFAVLAEWDITDFEAYAMRGLVA